MNYSIQKINMINQKNHHQSKNQVEEDKIIEEALTTQLKENEDVYNNLEYEIVMFIYSRTLPMLKTT